MTEELRRPGKVLTGPSFGGPTRLETVPRNELETLVSGLSGAQGWPPVEVQGLQGGRVGPFGRCRTGPTGEEAEVKEFSGMRRLDLPATVTLCWPNWGL